MDCSDAHPHLPVYADGELPPGLGESIEEHLSGCAQCRGNVERWRALRSAACRAGQSFALPSDLDEQICRALAAERGAALRRRRWTGGRLIGAAAVLLLAVTVWKFGLIPAPQDNSFDMAGLVVSPAKFAEYYGACANRFHCDQFDIRQEPVTFARTSISNNVKFAVAVPDLAERGYRVDGGCTCLKLNDTDVVHVYYRRDADDPNPVSIFSIPEQVRFAGPPESRTRNGKRAYQEAVSNDVAILIWSDEEGCYAACARLPRDELYDLVDSLDFASIVTRP